MLRILRWLIWGDSHAHHWKIIRQGNRSMQTGSGKELPNGYYYDLQCDVCGTVKVKKNT